jgi:hypothetical protein
MTDKSCSDNNNNYNYDEMAYPFIEIIKQKHELEATQENKPVKYTADNLEEIKIDMVQWYPWERCLTREPQLPSY